MYYVIISISEKAFPISRDYMACKVFLESELCAESERIPCKLCCCPSAMEHINDDDDEGEGYRAQAQAHEEQLRTIIITNSNRGDSREREHIVRFLLQRYYSLIRTNTAVQNLVVEHYSM